ncbi:hypothetical protein HW115_14410 [Verrucomicrobiaceae bacterium N1E253]|uniref:Protein kinase domain-containing protein n=1 Tax=Oceaniferula marina TaxID=2748318 RepID=A0A851GIN8_9BACT|nr:lipopolysaccharide kinase InaA family protein [Oceaniferula marina]NWK56812.1 hypothetical protein [Oceaniferula marina]
MSAVGDNRFGGIHPGDVLQLDIQETVHADFLGKMDVTFLSLLRYLPGRRSVWKARCEFGELFIKVFFPHPKQDRDVGREWRHSIRLHDAEMPMAEPYFLARGGEGCSILGFAYLEGGVTLDALASLAWQDADRSDVYRQLLDLHSRMFAAGIYQEDNHLGNYFWHQGEVRLLDAATCCFVDPPVDGGRLRENLSLLLANIPLPDRRCVDSLIANSDLRQAGVGGREASRAIQTRLRKYYRKTRRSCSEFELLREGAESWLLCRDLEPELREQVLSGMDALFAGGTWLKDGNTCSVVEVEVKGRSYIVKRYNRKPWLYRLLHCLATPRALESWSNGHVLRLFGIATPRPLACGVIRSGGLPELAYLVMEKVEGPPLWDLPEDELMEQGSGLAQQFGQLLWSLDTLQATHGDMKGSNLVVDQRDVLTLIDLDGTRFYCTASKHRKKRDKDIRRFLRNWDKMPEVRNMFSRVIDAVD